MSIQSPLGRRVSRMGSKTLVFLALFLVQVSCESKSSLTIVLDNTGSMDDELYEVKTAAKSIVDIVLTEKTSQIEDIVLVTFNDPDVAFRIRTRDADEFKQALDQVDTYNGECSEASMTGTKLALEESLPGSYLFVFTDAGAHDKHLLEKVILLCQEKQSQIVFVITGDICETNEEYYKIARACSGQVFIIKKTEIGQVLEYVRENIKGDRSVITNQVAPPQQWTNVIFNIDEKTEYAIVSATGKDVSLFPKDNLYRDLTNGYSYIIWTRNVKVLKLAKTSGGYVATVNGETHINIIVFARTDFIFEYGFSDKQESSLSTTETQPNIGTPTHLMISVKDEKNSVSIQAVQILDMDENLLRNLSLTNMGGSIYATEQFVPPEQTFQVAVTAIDRNTTNPLRRIARTPVAPIRPFTVAPEIIDSESYLKKEEGATVKLPCRIRRGKPRPSITWFFMKKGTTDYVQMRNKTDDVLHLTNVLMENIGHYKCVAENTVGRDDHTVQLEVEVAPIIDDSVTYLNKKEGSTVNIACRIQKGNPTPVITWFFMKKGTSDYLQMRGTTNEFLRLTNVLMDNEGHYKCVAENTVGRAEHIVQLDMAEPPRIVFSPPNVPKYRGVEGDVVMKLSCIAEGHPKPIISWTIDNYTIGTDKLNQSYVDDGSLFLKNPMSANSNNIYVCVATNIAGEQRQTYEVLISEFEDYNQPEKKYGVVGKPYEINCSLPFTDPNSVRWFYNSVSLNVTGASIRWETASRANDGNYTCRVSELSGAASVTVELTFGLPPSPSSGSTEFEEEWNDMLQVACMADLNMIGTYEWYLNGERIKDANERELNVHQFGFGNYTCRAANPLGSLNITYNIPSQDCVIDKHLWTTKNMPVIIDNMPAWPTYYSHNQKFAVVPQSDKLYLVCQDDPTRGQLGQPHSLNNSFTKFPSLKSIEATCDHEDTFLVAGASQKISELDCISSVTPSVVSTGKQCLGHNTQMIDVGFYVDDLIKVYSSCLDTNRNLLLYTTVTMNGLDVPQWTREPERPCTQVADCCYETVELVTAEDVGFGAAEWATLKEPRNSVFYCRPSNETITEQTTTADVAVVSPSAGSKQTTNTCTASWAEAIESPSAITRRRTSTRTASWTAAVESPSAITRRRTSTRTASWTAAVESPSAGTTENPFSQRSTTELPSYTETSWHDIERQVRNGPRMTVWSGAGNYTRVANMMVPQYLWKVVKNLDDDMSVAIVHSNAQAPIPKLCADDCRSCSVLALFKPHGVRTYCCSVDEFKIAFNIPLPF